jgi:hypothetical protein
MLAEEMISCLGEAGRGHSEDQLEKVATELLQVA